MNPYIVLWLILMVILFGIERPPKPLSPSGLPWGPRALSRPSPGASSGSGVGVRCGRRGHAAAHRPVLKKRLAVRHQPKKADKVYERPAVVTERIDNEAGTGTVSSGGKIWTARSADCVPIEAGTRVKVLSIEGVKLIVTPEAARVN
jgi:hypothetical protein